MNKKLIIIAGIISAIAFVAGYKMAQKLKEDEITWDEWEKEMCGIEGEKNC